MEAQLTMRVLVTGGYGFLGSHVVSELLRRDHEPVVVDNLSTSDLQNDPVWVEEAEWHVTELRDAGKVARGCDAIIHLACRFPVESDGLVWLEAWRGYVADFLQLLMTLPRKPKKVIVGSTLDVFGSQPGTFGSIVASLREALAYWHRPPFLSVEFLHMPEVFGYERMAPSALWTVPTADPLDIPRQPWFPDISHAPDVASSVVDRLEAAPRRSMDWTITGSRFEDGPPVSGNEALLLSEETIRETYSKYEDDETRSKT